MIYLITGIPGSGKTLYAVSTLIQSLMKDSFVSDSGETIKRRLVVDGIPALALPHEFLSKTVVTEKAITVEDGGSGVGNWWDWCQPGDVIVVDECQRIWRPRAMGAKPPQMVTELEMHRHRGVDFVIITQSPMLIDQNVRRLVGRHQHVRRLFGLKRALIYDWDGCQSDVHRVSSASKTLWSYPKDAFKLYKSAELHTKQKQKFPVWAALPVLAIIGGVAVGPRAYATLSGAMTGKGIAVGASQVEGKDKKTASATNAQPVAPVAPVAPASQVTVVQSDQSNFLETGGEKKPVFAGCVKSAIKCRCYDTSGVVLPEDLKMCGEHVAGSGLPPAKLPGSIPVLNAEASRLDQAASDGAALASMRPPEKKSYY
jgi:zona occludens toxin